MEQGGQGIGRPQPGSTGWGQRRVTDARSGLLEPAAAGGDGGADDGGLGDRRGTGAYGGADDGGLGDRRGTGA